VLYVVAFVNVWVMLVPVVMLVFATANCVHDPEELLIHVAVMVWLSESLHTTYRLGVRPMFVCPLVGAGLLCVGALFSVKLRVVFV